MDWKQECWYPDGRVETVVSEYELLCRDADVHGLHVELSIAHGRPVELGLSNGLGVDLPDLRGIAYASRVLRERLDREMG